MTSPPFEDVLARMVASLDELRLELLRQARNARWTDEEGLALGDCYTATLSLRRKLGDFAGAIGDEKGAA